MKPPPIRIPLPAHPKAGDNLVLRAEVRLIAGRERESVEGFALFDGERWVAYRNFCPHWGVDLDMGSRRFWAAKISKIVCRNHGAVFEPRTGLCELGPCGGESLVSWACHEHKGELEVQPVDEA